MKKLESLKESKFDAFESYRITSMVKILGGVVKSPPDGNGLCDSYDITKRDIKNSKGEVIGTVQDQDNVLWYDCPPIESSN